jgi:hypothetical protein
MEIEVNFHPEARREYLDALAWYRQHSRTVARAFQEEVHLGMKRIMEAPSQWPIFNSQVRWVRLNRFPDLLYFETLDSDHVQLLAVAHAKRRPGYWRDRQYW